MPANTQSSRMKLRTLGIAAAIVPTLGFSCHNEPTYAREGMSNTPAGSGWGTAQPAVTPPPAAAAPAAAPTPPAAGAAVKK